jgi:hypothetical protein
MSSEETQEVAIVKVPYLAPLAPFTTGISIEERFNSFHRANPQVYEALKQFSLHRRNLSVDFRHVRTRVIRKFV